jgi:type VI secretion system protein VasJ
MLGIKRSIHEWRWSAYGKHPVAKDYINVGQKFPLFDIFSAWIEKVYQMVASKKNPEGFCSWRFWTRESQRQNIVCGVIRDSSDSIGRPYPLLLMGTGPLKDWESQWDLLPLACENTWGQIEYLSVQMFDDLTKMESEVQNIRPPYPEWSKFIKEREDIINANSQGLREFDRQASDMSAKDACFICLDQGSSHDHFEMISVWHFLFKSHRKTAPSAAFMGGTAQRAHLVFFRRPVSPSDFIDLWSVSPEERREQQRGT